MDNYNKRRLNMLYNNLAEVMLDAATIRRTIERIKNTMAPHELTALDARLDKDIKAFIASHDVPRPEARPLHDKYNAVYDIKELDRENNNVIIELI